MWLDNHLVGWKCSNCGEYVVLDVQRQGNYCPVCGFNHKKEIKWLPERTMRDRTMLFAASGSRENQVLCVYGTVVNNTTFVSDEFTSTMDGQHFWDELEDFAKSKQKFIELRY